MISTNKTENTSSLTARAKALNIESNRGNAFCFLFRTLFLFKSEKWKIDGVYHLTILVNMLPFQSEYKYFDRM